MTEYNHSPHILLIEDDYEQRVIIGLLLEELEAEVAVLPDAFGVIEFLKKNPSMLLSVTGLCREYQALIFLTPYKLIRNSVLSLLS